MEMIINLDELNNRDNLKEGHPSNSLLTYHVTGDKDFTHFESQTPQYRKLKNEEFTSLALNPSEIDENQLLLARFPNLGSDDVIIPGTANLSFNIELTSTIDANRTLVSNIGRAIIKKLAVKFEGNEILSIDNFDIFAGYRDLSKTKSEKRNAIRQGIVSNGGCTNNYIKFRTNAGDKSTSNGQNNAIANTYGNKFIIPLDFEMLDSSAPYYQAGLGNRLCYEITFNDYN